MKFVYLLLFTFCFSKTYCQVIADPSINQLSFTNVSGNAIDDTLPLGYVAQLNVPIQNQSTSNALPAGSCKIKIGLGSKMILDPNFDLGLVNTSQYFSWSSELNSGQVQITGNLIADLPANFLETAKFNVQGSVLDYSTITTNFLITNHNTSVILSDDNPANNSTFRPYKIIAPAPIPVNFTSLFALQKDCKVDVSFGTENEINVNHYDIEISKDGVHYDKAGLVKAANLINYKFQFPITASISTRLLYLRIKSVDNDGSFKYSSAKTLNAECKGKISLSIYPNPVTSNTDYIIVNASGSLLNGKYRAALYDVTGRLISAKEFSFINQQQFTYPLGTIASGEYLLKVINTAIGKASTFKLQKIN